MPERSQAISGIPQKGGATAKKIQQATLGARVASEEAVEKSFKEWSESGFNPIAMARRFQTMEERVKRKDKPPELSEEAVEKVAEPEETASRFQRENPELKKELLLLLLKSITPKDSSEDILRKTLELFPDFSLADEALEFLMETSSQELVSKIVAAKEDLNKRFKREVRAGRNIGAHAREYPELGGPNELRELYREVTGEPKEPIMLFEELSNRFTFQKMQQAIQFFLHSLGADLKSKGPSISRAELIKLLDDTRSLQAILGVYRFFQSRMTLLHRLFTQEDIPLPPLLSFETMARQFVSLFKERYLASEKVLKAAKNLQVFEPNAQIIVINQMRDAIRQVAPKLYKNQKQKEDLLAVIIEALEELEEEEADEF